MKTDHNNHNAANRSNAIQEDAYSKSLKDIARRIAVLIVRRHRGRKPGSGKKTG